MDNHLYPQPLGQKPRQYLLQSKKPRGNLRIWDEDNSLHLPKQTNQTTIHKTLESNEKDIYDIYMPKSCRSQKTLPRIVSDSKVLEDETRRSCGVLKNGNKITARFHTDGPQPSEPIHSPATGHCLYKSKVKSNVVRTAQYEYEKGDLQILDIHHLNAKELPEYVASQIIGRNIFVKGSFGDKLKLYVDYASSGQDLKFIQDEMGKLEELYANTHTDASYVGAHMHHLVSQAEKMILKECKASPKDYFIISANSGTKYAIEMTQKIFGAFLPSQFKEQLPELLKVDKEQSVEELKSKLRAKGILPVVITSSYEHQPEEISWEKHLCDHIAIPFSREGLIDTEEFEQILKKYQANKRSPIICSISAGSNVTGVKADVLKIGQLCKKYGAILIVDYSAVGAYVPIDLSHKSEQGKPLVDAAYLAPHKFLGGPGTLGVLILNKQVYHGNLQPTHGGGGTVDIVGFDSEVYIEDYAEREKSGTPGILQIIKTALVFQLKGMLEETIKKNGENYTKIFMEKMSSNKNFVLLGAQQGNDVDKVPIISFNIKMNGPKGERFLHHNLVIRLLNDIFGIQSRAGCPCNESYAQYLFNVGETNKEVAPSLKVGCARIALHYILMSYEIDYLCFALNYLCDHGSKFLPLYKFDASTGIWAHKLNNWVVPTLKISKILNETRMYAKDEEGRKSIFENQKKEAMGLLETLAVSQELDVIEEAGELYKFYVEKGNILNREALQRKM